MTVARLEGNADKEGVATKNNFYKAPDELKEIFTFVAKSSPLIATKLAEQTNVKPENVGDFDRHIYSLCSEKFPELTHEIAEVLLLDFFLPKDIKYNARRILKGDDGTFFTNLFSFFDHEAFLAYHANNNNYGIGYLLAEMVVKAFIEYHNIEECSWINEFTNSNFKPVERCAYVMACATIAVEVCRRRFPVSLRDRHHDNLMQRYARLTLGMSRTLKSALPFTYREGSGRWCCSNDITHAINSRFVRYMLLAQAELIVGSFYSGEDKQAIISKFIREDQ